MTTHRHSKPFAGAFPKKQFETGSQWNSRVAVGPTAFVSADSENEEPASSRLFVFLKTARIAG